MGVRILTGKKDDGLIEAACFYDSVTDTAFGPVMDNEEEAIAFLDYLKYPSNEKDPRTYSDAELEDAYVKFRKERRLENESKSA